MNQKENQELEELYNDLKEEARFNGEKRKKHDRIMIEQLMKVCSREEILKLLEELENKKELLTEFMMLQSEKN